MNEPCVCRNIRRMSFLDNPNESEFIFSYNVKGFGEVYKFYKDGNFRDIINCPKCGRKLRCR